MVEASGSGTGSGDGWTAPLPNGAPPSRAVVVGLPTGAAAAATVLTPRGTGSVRVLRVASSIGGDPLLPTINSRTIILIVTTTTPGALPPREGAIRRPDTGPVSIDEKDLPPNGGGTEEESTGGRPSEVASSLPLTDGGTPSSTSTTTVTVVGGDQMASSGAAAARVGGSTAAAAIRPRPVRRRRGGIVRAAVRANEGAGDGAGAAGPRRRPRVPEAQVAAEATIPTDATRRKAPAAAAVLAPRRGRSLQRRREEVPALGRRQPRGAAVAAEIAAATERVRHGTRDETTAATVVDEEREAAALTGIEMWAGSEAGDTEVNIVAGPKIG